MYLVTENAFKKHFYCTVHVNDEIGGHIQFLVLYKCI